MGPEGPRGQRVGPRGRRGDRPRRPALAEVGPAGGGGWTLEERGLIQRHGKGFVNGEDSRGETPVGADDGIEVLRSMTLNVGGADLARASSGDPAFAQRL
jgi:hypothetical protein